MILATPFVVKRGLKGLIATAAHAESIDVHERTTRLPLDGVASEIRPLVNAVNRAFDRLNEGYDRQERFLADAAHELRTPIAILHTRIENLAEGAERTRLLADAARLSVLAGQLLDLQRMKAQGTGRQRIELVALARRWWPRWRRWRFAAGYEVSFEPLAARVEIEGDRDAIARALANLVRNAIEHAGGMGAVTVRVMPPGDIEVIDDGPGIPAALREQIFKPFHRGHATGPGAGLGLSLVQEIARLHGGDVTVHDAPGGGALFRLRLRPGRSGEAPA